MNCIERSVVAIIAIAGPQNRPKNMPTHSVQTQLNQKLLSFEFGHVHKSPDARVFFVLGVCVCGSFVRQMCANARAPLSGKHQVMTSEMRRLPTGDTPACPGGGPVGLLLVYAFDLVSMTSTTIGHKVHARARSTICTIVWCVFFGHSTTVIRSTSACAPKPRGVPFSITPWATHKHRCETFVRQTCMCVCTVPLRATKTHKAVFDDVYLCGCVGQTESARSIGMTKFGMTHTHTQMIELRMQIRYDLKNDRPNNM